MYKISEAHPQFRSPAYLQFPAHLQKEDDDTTFEILWLLGVYIRDGHADADPCGSCGYAHMQICASRCACKNLDAHQPHTGAKYTAFPHLIPPSIYGVMYVLELDLAVESASHQYE